MAAGTWRLCRGRRAQDKIVSSRSASTTAAPSAQGARAALTPDAGAALGCRSYTEGQTGCPRYLRGPAPCSHPKLHPHAPAGRRAGHRGRTTATAHTHLLTVVSSVRAPHIHGGERAQHFDQKPRRRMGISLLSIGGRSWRQSKARSCPYRASRVRLHLRCERHSGSYSVRLAATVSAVPFRMVRTKGGVIRPFEMVVLVLLRGGAGATAPILTAA